MVAGVECLPAEAVSCSVCDMLVGVAPRLRVRVHACAGGAEYLHAYIHTTRLSLEGLCRHYCLRIDIPRAHCTRVGELELEA